MKQFVFIEMKKGVKIENALQRLAEHLCWGEIKPEGYQWEICGSFLVITILF